MLYCPEGHIFLGNLMFHKELKKKKRFQETSNFQEMQHTESSQTLDCDHSHLRPTATSGSPLSIFYTAFTHVPAWIKTEFENMEEQMEICVELLGQKWTCHFLFSSKSISVVANKAKLTASHQDMSTFSRWTETYTAISGYKQA